MAHRKSNGGNGVQNQEETTDSASATEPSSTELFAATTALGDLRDKIWSALGDYAVLLKVDEKTQRNLADRITDILRLGIERLVADAAAFGFPTIVATVDTVTLKPKAVEAKLVIVGVGKAALVDAHQRQVVIVNVDPGRYMGARGAVAIDRDQPDLPIDSVALGEGATAPDREGGIDLKVSTATGAAATDDPPDLTPEQSAAYREGREDRRMGRSWDFNPEGGAKQRHADRLEAYWKSRR